MLTEANSLDSPIIFKPYEDDDLRPEDLSGDENFDEGIVIGERVEGKASKRSNNFRFSFVGDFHNEDSDRRRYSINPFYLFATWIYDWDIGIYCGHNTDSIFYCPAGQGKKFISAFQLFNHYVLHIPHQNFQNYLLPSHRIGTNRSGNHLAHCFNSLC